jgi:hypothetical protein
MTKLLRISDDLALPLETAATQTYAFLARKGAGKTYAAGKLAELLIAARVQVVVLDSVGNWYGLRLAADGKGPGLDVPVLGGLRGDVPLEDTGGELVANTLVDTGRSAVLDISQFSMAGRQRFATAFATRLWARKKAEADPAPLHLVIEESQLIVPQNVRGDTAKMVGIYEEIIRLGRNYGIGVSMISQRPQSVNKEVLNQTECLFVLQTNGKQERDALKSWIVAQGADVDLVKELPSLPIGTAYVWSPQWLGVFKRVQIAAKVTFDASSTPRVGQKRSARELAPLDLGALKEAMAATIERAKAEDPKALRAELALARKRIAELERAPAKTETKEVPALSAQDRKLLAAVKESFELFTKKIDESFVPTLRGARGAFEGYADVLAKLTGAPPPRGAQPFAPSAQPARPIPHSAPRRPTNGHAGAGDTSLPKGERITLIAIAQHADGVTREQLTVLTGYKRSTRDAYLQRLRERGHTEDAGGRIVASDSGVAALGSDYEPLPTGDALREHWLTPGQLPEGEAKVLEVLCAMYPKPVPRESIDEATGFKRSTRDAYLQRLAARRLVSSGRDGVIASAELFG